MISNDANRSVDEMDGVNDGERDAGARRLMLFRQQAALYYEAADFLAKSVPRFDSLKAFIAVLPQDARDDFDRIIAGADPKSPRYLGQWLEDHRNSTFHYREMHPEKWASGQDEIAQALEAAAEHEGTVFVGDTLGSVRFWFADQLVVSKWLPDSQQQAGRVVELRESLLTLLRLTQRAWAAYTAPLPEGTIEERP
jgi:hypothetical protein